MGLTQPSFIYLVRKLFRRKENMSAKSPTEYVPFVEVVVTEVIVGVVDALDTVTKERQSPIEIKNDVVSLEILRLITPLN
jgi:hypothetical protein